MRINPEVYQKRLDMNGEVRIPNCEPYSLKVVAERLMQMLIGLDYSVGNYNTVTELDKLLTLDYWTRYDDFANQFKGNGLFEDCINIFRKWYTLQATEPDMISRARRWLVSHHYIFLKEGVEEQAQTAGANFGKAVKPKWVYGEKAKQ